MKTYEMYYSTNGRHEEELLIGEFEDLFDLFQYVKNRPFYEITMRAWDITIYQNDELVYSSEGEQTDRNSQLGFEY